MGSVLYRHFLFGNSLMSPLKLFVLKFLNLASNVRVLVRLRLFDLILNQLLSHFLFFFFKN